MATNLYLAPLLRGIAIPTTTTIATISFVIAIEIDVTLVYQSQLRPWVARA